jgi:hypothetical protein
MIRDFRLQNAGLRLHDKPICNLQSPIVVRWKSPLNRNGFCFEKRQPDATRRSHTQKAALFLEE